MRRKKFRLPPKSPRRFAFDASEEECAAIATDLDLKAVRKLSVDATIRLIGDAVWSVEGNVKADVVQTCVVTLAPVKAKLSEDFSRVISASAKEEDELDIDIDYEADDPPEPLGDGVDLG